MDIRVRLTSLCSLFLTLISISNGKTVVHLNQTQIIGKMVQVSGIQVKQFLGIPYAKPPMGALRFKKTVPLEKYPSVINALNQPPACEQYVDLPYPSYMAGIPVSEDCLYLNIWTPKDASIENPKAVMLYVHGGAFSFGAIRNPLYDGRVLSGLGDIIVVNVAYRLGPLGFLTLFSKDVDFNAGVWDVFESLKWVNRHIAAFGGDASRITIAGESSGSMIVGLLGMSPLAKGLYRRQIMESGSPFILGRGTNLLTFLTSAHFARSVGCDSLRHAELVACLREKDAMALTKNYYYSTPRMIPLPVVGLDELIPKTTEHVLQHQLTQCHELLIGNNRDEGSSQLTAIFPHEFGFFGAENPDFKETINKFLPQSMKFIGNSLGSFLERAHDRVRKLLYTLVGDVSLICPDVYYAEKCSTQGNVYYYWWTHRPSNSRWADWMGATLFDQVPFVHGTGPVVHPEMYEKKEVALSQELIGIWSNFVKTGKPGSLEWPLYTKTTRVFRNITIHPEPEFGRGPHEAECKIIKPAILL